MIGANGFCLQIAAVYSCYARWRRLRPATPVRLHDMSGMRSHGGSLHCSTFRPGEPEGSTLDRGLPTKPSPSTGRRRWGRIRVGRGALGVKVLGE